MSSPDPKRFFTFPEAAETVRNYWSSHPSGEGRSLPVFPIEVPDKPLREESAHAWALLKIISRTARKEPVSHGAYWSDIRLWESIQEHSDWLRELYDEFKKIPNATMNITPWMLLLHFFYAFELSARTSEELKTAFRECLRSTREDDDDDDDDSELGPEDIKVEVIDEAVESDNSYSGPGSEETSGDDDTDMDEDGNRSWSSEYSDTSTSDTSYDDSNEEISIGDGDEEGEDPEYEEEEEEDVSDSEDDDVRYHGYKPGTMLRDLALRQWGQQLWDWKITRLTESTCDRNKAEWGVDSLPEEEIPALRKEVDADYRRNIQTCGRVEYGLHCAQKDRLLHLRMLKQDNKVLSKEQKTVSYRRKSHNQWLRRIFWRLEEEAEERRQAKTAKYARYWGNRRRFEGNGLGPLSKDQVKANRLLSRALRPCNQKALLKIAQQLSSSGIRHKSLTPTPRKKGGARRTRAGSI